MKNTDELPILVWFGVPETHTNVERFQEMKDAGINYSFSYYSHIDSLQKALDIAAQFGIKLLLRCPELYSDTENLVKRFIDHPANGGYHLRDEPTNADFSFLKSLANKIEKIDNTRFSFINLFPNYAEPHLESSYEEYVNQYVFEIPLKLLSFDYYPISNNIINYNWYENLELIKRTAEVAEIPFWAFALTTAHSTYPIPDINHLRLQVFSNLAYGAKGIQYFTYWTPISNTWDFNNGPINANGYKTKVYELIKQLNNEINVYSNIFLSSKVINVRHYGDNKKGTLGFTEPPSFVKYINIRGGNALISELKSSTNSYLMIQNTNLNKDIGIKVATDERISIILKNGYIIPATLIKTEFKLTPGDMVIFMR